MQRGCQRRRCCSRRPLLLRMLEKDAELVGARTATQAPVEGADSVCLACGALGAQLLGIVGRIEGRVILFVSVVVANKLDARECGSRGSRGCMCRDLGYA
jgi:hypothetical protein